jgi:ribose transport system substrate-binding protein
MSASTIRATGHSAPRRRSTVRMAGVCAAALLALTACSSASDKSGTGGSGSADAKVAFSSPFGISQAVTYLTAEVETQLRGKKFSVLSSTNANGDSAKQVTDIQNLISAGAKGLIVDSNDSDAILPALAYAKSKDVKVVAIDVRPNGGPAAAMVTADQVGIGRLACKAMADGIGGKGKVLSLQGAATSYNGRNRTKGFADCIKKDYPDIQLIEKATDWDPAKQAAAVQTVLSSDPDLKGIYQQADYALSPTLAAVKQAGHGAKAGEDGHIYMVSVDGTSQGLDLIRSGEIDAEISQPINEFAILGAQYLAAAMKDSAWKLPLGKTDHDSEVVDFKGVRADLLPAKIVTKENVDDKANWGNQASQ